MTVVVDIVVDFDVVYFFPFPFSSCWDSSLYRWLSECSGSVDLYSLVAVARGQSLSKKKKRNNCRWCLQQRTNSWLPTWEQTQEPRPGEARRLPTSTMLWLIYSSPSSSSSSLSSSLFFNFLSREDTEY